MPRIKHWVGYTDEGKPINVPAIDIKNPAIWYRHDGYGGVSPFFTVWGDKRVAHQLILESYGHPAQEIKPYIRVSTDVFRYVMEKLKMMPEIQIADQPYRSKTSATTDLVIQPFSVAKNQPRSTLTERRKVFKYIRDIIIHESSWDPRVAVYEKSHEATMGFLFFYEHTMEEDES